jgi:hypothetical protein
MYFDSVVVPMLRGGRVDCSPPLEGEFDARTSLLPWRLRHITWQEALRAMDVPGTATASLSLRDREIVRYHLACPLKPLAQ